MASRPTSFNQSEDSGQGDDLKDVGAKKKFKPFKAIRRIIRDGKKNVKVPAIFKGQSLPEEDPELTSEQNLDRRISLSHDSIFNPDPSLLETSIRHAPKSAPKSIVKPPNKSTIIVSDDELPSPNAVLSFKDELNKKLNLSPRARSPTIPGDHLLSTSAPSGISFFSVKPRVTVKQISTKDPQNEATQFQINSPTEKDEDILKLKHNAAYAKIEARPKHRKPRRKLKLSSEINNQNNSVDLEESKNLHEVSPLEQNVTVTTNHENVDQPKEFFNKEAHAEDKEDVGELQHSISSEIPTSPSNDTILPSQSDDANKLKKYARSHSENEPRPVTSVNQGLVKAFSYDSDKRSSKLSIKKEKPKDESFFEISSKTRNNHSKKEREKTSVKKLNPIGQDQVSLSQNNEVSGMSDANASAGSKESNAAIYRQNLKKTNSIYASNKCEVKDDDTLDSSTKAHVTADPLLKGVMQQLRSPNRGSEMDENKLNNRSLSHIAEETSKSGVNILSNSKQGSVLKKQRNLNQVDTENQNYAEGKSKSRVGKSSTKIVTNSIHEEKVSANKDPSAEENSPKTAMLKENMNVQLQSMPPAKLRKKGPKKQLAVHNTNYNEEMTQESVKQKINQTSSNTVSYWKEMSKNNNNRYSDFFDPRINALPDSPTMKQPTVTRSASTNVEHKSLSVAKDIHSDEKDESLLNPSAPSWVSLARTRSKKWGQLGASNGSIEETGESKKANYTPLSKSAASGDSSTASLSLKRNKNFQAANFRNTGETPEERSPTSNKYRGISGKDQIEKQLLEQRDDPPWLAVAMAKQKRWSYGETV